VRVLFIAAAAAALITVRPAQAQAVPDLNVDPVCHGIAQQAANPSEKGAPDLAFSKCVQSEQAMRQKLVNEWSTFLPTKKPTASANRSRQLPRNGERRAATQSRQVSNPARSAAG
jgi:hypothetical protein